MFRTGNQQEDRLLWLVWLSSHTAWLKNEELMVYQKSPLVRTKLMPPRLHRRILIRPRLTSLLLGALDYRLTILQAGAGYGLSLIHISEPTRLGMISYAV